MQDKYKKEIDILIKYNQEELLEKIENFTDEEKDKIFNQISKINFEELKYLYENINKKEDENDNSEIEPIDAIDKEKLSIDELRRLELIGQNAIKDGKFAVITMAGGQGTRLGHNGPKGTYEFDLEKHKSIFEVLCDKFKEAYQKYNIYVSWYIMTSEDNNDETISFFESKNYFNYPKDKIKFFVQGKLPMLDINGKLIIDENKKIKYASNGHGGLFSILSENGILSEMKQNGIEWFYTGAVDNVLGKLIDPLFVGVAIDKNVLAAGKSLIKCCPEEKIGVFVKKNGKPSVVEYIEISKEMSEELNDDGELKYGEGHILCNLFNVKVIDKLSKEKLPYHAEFKKANYIDKNGNIVKVTEPNAYKFEAFLFDAFEKLNDMVVLRVKREEEFAPIKNAEGVDSPESARKLFNNYYGIK